MITPESQQKRSAEWEKQLTADRTAMLALPAFCRVMQSLLASTGVWRISFAGEQTHAMAFNEGMRNVGLRVMADLEAAEPTALLRLKEHAMPTPEHSTDD